MLIQQPTGQVGLWLDFGTFFLLDEAGNHLQDITTSIVIINQIHP
jgi:hypothetical protein